MTAEIIPLPVTRGGNGAREALIDILTRAASHPLGNWDAHAVADYIIASLYVEGFVVAPIKD